MLEWLFFELQITGVQPLLQGSCCSVREAPRYSFSSHRLLYGSQRTFWISLTLRCDFESSRYVILSEFTVLTPAVLTFRAKCVGTETRKPILDYTVPVEWKCQKSEKTENVFLTIQDATSYSYPACSFATVGPVLDLLSSTKTFKMR